MRMVELGQRVRARREEFGLRQTDLVDQMLDFLPANYTYNIDALGGLERGHRARMIPPEEVAAYERVLRWPVGTILEICGYAVSVPAGATESNDVIATLMDAVDLTDRDKQLVADMVRSMRRRGNNSS